MGVRKKFQTSYPHMPLTDVAIRKAQPRAKPYKLFDGGGLYLLVSPAGDKHWRLKYRSPFERNKRGELKEKLLALGAYPAVRLPEARAKRDDAKKLLANGRDPMAVKQETERAASVAAENTFETIAREWFEKFSPKWAKSHADKIIARLENNIFPFLGKRPIKDITAPELLAVLRKIESRGAVDTAHRAHQNCGQVFRYAISTSRAER
ncbi:MAG TPA: integrase arm-type DNA-binding domain-containing protein, partial [Burkholderiales bacterium]